MRGVIDRNPTTVVRSYAAGGVAPHPETDRWTYTVPTGRRAAVTYAEADVFRDAAPSTLGVITVSIYYNNNLVLRSIVWNNTVGARDFKLMTGLMVLNPGDTLRATTEDSSTGGSANYRISAMIVEFDA